MTINDPIYGQIKITKPVLLELIATPAMQRLKGVDQNVTGRLVDLPWGKYSRFDHSIGVMQLIKLLGGSLEEQIAGLVHDISHTAFSHAMDFVFGKAEVQDFHEEHLENIITESNIPAILQTHAFNVKKIIDHHNFPILEQKIPALCADRVDYALKTFHQSQGHSLAVVKNFLNHLKVFDGQIVFTEEVEAHRFASMFLRADQTAWGGSALCNAAYYLFAEIIKKEYRQGKIVLEDFFGTDQEFLNKLSVEARAGIAKIKDLRVLEVGPHEDYHYHLKAKIRYVDPLVQINDKEAKKLSEISPEFKHELEIALAKRRAGNYVKIIE